MLTYTVPGVGRVVVELHEHVFGMTGEKLVLLGDVSRADGTPLGVVNYERVAQYLHATDVI
ncbi:hypothetical protein SAMN04487848_0173 [Microbacterium sp. ru370.1]|uniref:hypothetical protein n=1 Tax=unclassified Microbacterium TaxID=2609290 RepID=UPI0008879A4A|nr:MULTISPECIES: hypothetical protein [unclassified Microbacterium]SDO28013.1 hypothetical protein SAMN04487848_0173 [Microbacterium sp. ru370.1]SIT75021.1 hypothetical protein SAMN05880579_0169 [Microbacterium sp. RU1D]